MVVMAISHWARTIAAGLVVRISVAGPGADVAAVRHPDTTGGGGSALDVVADLGDGFVGGDLVSGGAFEDVEEDGVGDLVSREREAGRREREAFMDLRVGGRGRGAGVDGGGVWASVMSAILPVLTSRCGGVRWWWPQERTTRPA